AVEHISEVKTYNVTTDLMSDDYLPNRIAQSAMMWLGPDGELGELECIFPKITERPCCNTVTQIETKEGFPLLEIVSNPEEVSVMHQKDGFIIWLDQTSEVNIHLSYGNVVFLLADKQLVGIDCKHMNTP
ncbi:hypothetical protein BZG17_32115, partial [Escherichia coli]|nr:hypothetical protein [Escherichia coli]